MNTVTKTFDTNAHIDNLECYIEIENDTPVALISFENISEKSITAIKFVAKGYTAFGDEIKVNDKEFFTIIIQDICIRPNKTVTNIREKLPDKNIRDVVLQEYVVKFDDNTVVKYEGANEIQVDLIKLASYPDGKELVEAAKYFTSLQFEYMPVQLDSGWVCTCGRYNHNNTQKCSCCGIAKDSALSVTNKNFTASFIQKYRTHIQESKKLASIQKAEEAKNKKNERNKRTKIIIATVISIILVVTVIYGAATPNVRTFNSAEEMRLYSQGFYGKSYSDRIQILGNRIIYHISYANGATNYQDVAKWDYKTGKIIDSGGNVIYVLIEKDSQKRIQYKNQVYTNIY